MGWERKRGKLEQFNAALRGRLDAFATIVGDGEQLRDVKYVIVLDSDTQLPRDAARELAGTLAHPLNRPRLDPRSAGWSRPRDPAAARGDHDGERAALGFARLFAGEPGIDPYTRAVSDVYQDLFAEGSFVGKGIYDVDAFQRASPASCPRTASSATTCSRARTPRRPRQRRAAVRGLPVRVRGRRQPPPPLDPRRLADRRVAARAGPPAATAGRVRNPISALSRWKMLDNLRRSLVPPALLALLGLGWAPPGLAGPATLVVLAILVVPGLLAAAALLAAPPGRAAARQPPPRDLRRPRPAARARGVRAGLPAPRRAGQRRARSPARWRGCCSPGAGCSSGAPPATRSAAPAPTSAAPTHSCGSRRRSPIAALVGLGLTQPARCRGRPRSRSRGCSRRRWCVASAGRARRSAACSAPATVVFLRGVARRTWRFFETFVAAEDNDLPPDNYQEDPPQGVAHRTSPTNIGLALTANLAAYDFGYLAAARCWRAATRTIAAMDRLQRHRGHFYNWYDTRTLEPLRPIYISTVDSGNLAGHLLTSRRAARARRPPDLPRRRSTGLRDTLACSPRSRRTAGARRAATVRELLARARHAVGRAPARAAARGDGGARRGDRGARRRDAVVVGQVAWRRRSAAPPTSWRGSPRGRR
jgi:cyclic beta-1,2-glucan synthetase